MPTEDAATGRATLQDELRAAKARATNRQTRDFPIPGYEGRLWGTFRALDDYADVRAIIAEHGKVADAAEQEQLIAADTLVKSCTRVFALRDGEQHDLGMGLGRDLAAFLGDEVENDRQGIFAVIPNSLLLMSFYGEIDRWFRGTEAAATSEASGKSEAANS